MIKNILEVHKTYKYTKTTRKNEHQKNLLYPTLTRNLNPTHTKKQKNPTSKKTKKFIHNIYINLIIITRRSRIRVERTRIDDSSGLGI
jgi:hypothetical protein